MDILFVRSKICGIPQMNDVYSRMSGVFVFQHVMHEPAFFS